MKKKAMLSEEALKLMLSASEEESALGEDVQAAETNEVVIPDAVEPEAADGGPKFDAYQKDVDEFKAAAEASLGEIEALKADLAKANESSAELKGIVADQVSKMRLALKLPAVDMSAMAVDAIVTEFNTTKESFMKALPVGSVIPEKKEDKRVESPVATSLDASKIKSLGF